jgi:hypothetical protein
MARPDGKRDASGGAIIARLEAVLGRAAPWRHDQRRGCADSKLSADADNRSQRSMECLPDLRRIAESGTAPCAEGESIKICAGDPALNDARIPITPYPQILLATIWEASLHCIRASWKATPCAECGIPSMTAFTSYIPIVVVRRAWRDRTSPRQLGSSTRAQKEHPGHWIADRSGERPMLDKRA